MILLVNYYKDKNKERQAEIDECLRKNIEHPLIDRIIIFKDEHIEVPADKKIIPVRWNGRPSYSDYFRIGSKYNDIKILANSDIYFDESLEYCNTIKDKQVFALCRWNKVNGSIEFYNRIDSQDVWIWKGNVSVQCNFGLGFAGCDNSIAYKLTEAGYKVLSPSKKIKAIHFHDSGIRNYLSEKMERINGPYMYLRCY